MSSRACYCAHCGATTPEQSITPLPANRRCPRCAATLQRRDFATDDGGATLVECEACAGLWLAPAVFDHFCRRAAAAAAAWTGLLPKPRKPVLTEGVVRYLPSPDCGERMQRRNWGGDSGVVVDCCRPHGLWFDHDELARVLDYLRGGGSRNRQRTSAADGGSDTPDRHRAMEHALRLRGELDGSEWVGEAVSALATFVNGLWRSLFRERRPPASVVLQRPLVRRRPPARSEPPPRRDGRPR